MVAPATCRAASTLRKSARLAGDKPLPVPRARARGQERVRNHAELSAQPTAYRARHVSGTFLTRVFEGPYANVHRWVQEMKTYVAARQKKLEKLYFFYTTCPKCAKFYGKNYIVLLAKV